jgi:glucose-1-phosphate adenylyltransferase
MTVDKVKDFLVLSGEHLYDMDYADLIRQHRETDADITISCVGVSRTNKALFGVDGTGLGLVTLSEDLGVQRFTEKPSM